MRVVRDVRMTGVDLVNLRRESQIRGGSVTEGARSSIGNPGVTLRSKRSGGTKQGCLDLITSIAGKRPSPIRAERAFALLLHRLSGRAAPRRSRSSVAWHASSATDSRRGADRTGTHGQYCRRFRSPCTVSPDTRSWKRRRALSGRWRRSSSPSGCAPRSCCGDLLVALSLAILSATDLILAAGPTLDRLKPWKRVAMGHARKPSGGRRHPARRRLLPRAQARPAPPYSHRDRSPLATSLRSRSPAALRLWH